MSESRKTGLLRLCHLREVNEATSEEMAEQRERFATLADPSSAPRVVTSFNLFQTPEPLADMAASMLQLTGRILEPSAGLGRLYRAIRARGDCPVTLVDISPACCAELYREIDGDKAARLVQADFLACDVERLGGMFDGVLMNPPFKQGQDIKHIKHAIKLLRPGGQIVAFCANGPRQREHLKPLAAEWHDLPEGSFKGEGTNVNAAIVVIGAPFCTIKRF